MLPGRACDLSRDFCVHLAPLREGPGSYANATVRRNQRLIPLAREYDQCDPAKFIDFAMTLDAETAEKHKRNATQLMLWTAPPPARECHGCGCC